MNMIRMRCDKRWDFSGGNDSKFTRTLRELIRDTKQISERAIVAGEIPWMMGHVSVA